MTLLLSGVYAHMKSTGTNPTTDARAYRSYLIRFSAMSASLGRSAFWIEKDGHFIAHATSEADAKATIDMLVS